MGKPCHVCGGNQLEPRNDYRHCVHCGHESLANPAGQTFMVNESLDVPAAGRAGVLDRFKLNALQRFRGAVGADLLVDFGSASGRFLAGCRRHFSRVIGVEVTQAAAAYARREYGLEILDDVAALPQDINVVTMWHSLEHVPTESIDAILGVLAKRLAKEGLVIVSVPNAGSLQYRVFGRRYAFYDAPHHHHQFSVHSLELTMGKHGLRPYARMFSGVYNVFGWIQGFLNTLPGPRNYLYYRLKRRSVRRQIGLDLLHFCGAALFVTPALGLTFVEFILHRRQSVITECFMKRSD